MAGIEVIVVPMFICYADTPPPPHAFITMCLAGDRDLICNWLGHRRWVDQLEWEGQEGWAQAEDKPWSVRGKQVGEVTTYDTLTFVKVYEAVSVVLFTFQIALLQCVLFEQLVACVLAICEGTTGWRGYQL